MAKQATKTAKPEFMSLADLNKAIDAAIRKSNGLDKDLQAIGLSALNHLAVNGDIGPVNRVLLGLGKGTRKGSLAQWFLNWGALKHNEDAETQKEKPFVYDKARTTNMEGAKEQHWTEAKKPDDVSEAIDVTKALWALIARAKKQGVTAGSKELFKALEAITPAKG